MKKIYIEPEIEVADTEISYLLQNATITIGTGNGGNVAEAKRLSAFDFSEDDFFSESAWGEMEE